MLSGVKLKKLREDNDVDLFVLASAISRPGFDAKRAKSAILNWEKGLMKPQPSSADIAGLAQGLNVDRLELMVWQSTHRYAPMAPRKVRLVADLIRGCYAQEALDILQFTNKRAAGMVKKVLQCAIANADEQEADIARLYVSDARVDEGGIRLGTRRWRPKDRGRAVSFTRLASHIHVTVGME
jgi:large subunit ribosomal protein L22